MEGHEIPKPSKTKRTWWLVARKQFSLHFGNVPNHEAKSNLDPILDQEESPEADDTPTPIQQNEGTGKFLIFELRRDIDAAWNKIKTATENGELGFASKVSTRKRKPIEIGGETNSHVICVYTNGTEKEKEKVLQRLRELGFVRRIPYKTDRATLAGEYSAQNNAKKRTASDSRNSGEGTSTKKPFIREYVKPYVTYSEYTNQRYIHIKQTHPPTGADILMPIDQLEAVMRSIYQLANTIPPSGEKLDTEIQGIKTTHVGTYAKRSEVFDGEFTIHIKSAKSYKEVMFPQFEGMWVYKRLHWWKERPDLYGPDQFSSDESDQDEDVLDDENSDDEFQPPSEDWRRLAFEFQQKFGGDTEHETTN